MRVQHPATTALLVTLAAMIGAAAQVVAGTWVSPSAIATAAVSELPPELVLLFSNPRETNRGKAKRRAELHLIDFVELMWPVIEPEQPFVRSWVQEAICMHLEAITTGRITNFLGNVPPGSTKSYLVNVFWPAWEWGPQNRPDLRYMSWSYSPKLTEDANEACRKIIESDVYQEFWGDRFEILSDTDAKSYYKNDKGGWRRASSIKGGATGYRADRLIWDDPINVKDADSKAELRLAQRWFSRTLPTRVRNASSNISRVKVPFWVREVHGLGLEDNPDDGDRKATMSATVGIMQRVHLHDIAGIILKNPALNYEVLIIEMRYKGAAHPARKLDTWRPSTVGYEDPRGPRVAAFRATIAEALLVPKVDRDAWWNLRFGMLEMGLQIAMLADPIRFPEEAVQGLEAQMMLEGGSDAVAAQLDQWPLAEIGSTFSIDKLPVIEPHEVPPGVISDWRGWDWAGSDSATADRTASARTTRGTNKRFYLMHTAAQAGGPAATDRFVKQQHKDDPPSVRWSLPKDPGGTSIHFNAYVCRELCPGRDVESSREEGDKEFRARPVASQAAHDNFVIVRHPGWEIARQELIDFPYGEHDDIVDAISRSFMQHVTAPPEDSVSGGGGFIIRPAA